MASTGVPLVAGLAVARHCEPRPNPNPNPNPSPNPSPSPSHCHARTRILCESDGKLLCLPFQESIQSVFPSSRSLRRAASPSWRCRTGDQSSGLEAISAEDQDPIQDVAAVQDGLRAQYDLGDDELLPVAAARLVKVEQEKQKYLGRALRAGKGAVIAELLQIFGNLLERPYGGGESVANAGGAVIERVVNDVQELRGQDGVNDQMLFELLKVIRLLEMDMELLRAARQEETLYRRLDTAQMHCKQAYAIANSF